MAYRQDGPVPEQVRLTLRVDSDTNPALADLLWTMPWGSRNAAVIELLELGYRAKQGGLTLPSATPQPRPASIPTIPSSRSATLVPSVHPAPPADPLGSIKHPIPTAPPIATAEPPSTGADAQLPPEEATDEPSPVSLLLGQF